jgi:predicted nucleic acid-binding protein
MNVDRLVHTDFLIDRWRNGEGSGAAVYARAHRDDSLALPWIVKAEFLHLMELAGYDAEKIAEFLGRYPTYWPDDELLVDYARLGVTLSSHAVSLSSEDLWIAASALRLDVALVTRNVREFGKVAGIKLDPY